jgi:hypothetical protein
LSRVFSPSSFAKQAQQVVLREKLDAMPKGKLKDGAEAEWAAKDYSAAVFWEDTSHNPPYAQLDV